jgi:ATP-dependent DNA ligase
MDNMQQQFLEFVSKISVMKPNSIKEDNAKQVDKLQQILLSDEYAAEEKTDGCHYIMFHCRFFSTEGCEKTDNYPHLRDFFLNLNMPNIILDGEINFPGKTSQFCTRVTGSGSDVAVSFQNDYGLIHYTMWDMLRTPKGTWLVNQTYEKRRETLEYYYDRYIKGTSMEQYIHLAERRVKGKKQFYEEIINSGREGIVLKKLDSLYIMGKDPMWQWMKMKQKDTADFYISGFEAPKVLYEGKNIQDWPYWLDVRGVLSPVTKYHYNNWIGALELSAYVDGEPTKICTCSGISETLREQISQNPKDYLNRVIKVSFMEATEAGYPRHPRFEQFHESKRAQECTWQLS